MNRLDDLIRDTFADDAEHAPPAAPVVARLLADQRPRVPYLRPGRRRGSWLATTAAAAVTATIVAVGVAIIGGGGSERGDDRAAGLTTLTGSGGFEQRMVTYAEGSTIHYGDRTLDVAPRQPIAMVQTDDGFVFATAPDRAYRYDVYLTNGAGVDRIGQASGFTHENGVLVSDDTGSYVGWVDGDEAVVYDTAGHREVLRTPVPDPEEQGPHAAGWRSVAAIDGDLAYVASLDAVEVWDLSDGTKANTITRRNVPDDYLDPDRLNDVANGYFLWYRFAESGDPGYVSRNPYVEQPAVPDNKIGSSNTSLLSPDARYVATDLWILDRKTVKDVTPEDGPKENDGLIHESVLQWLDNDRYVADTPHNRNGDGRHDLLVCSVTAGTCRVAVELVGEIVYPDGIEEQLPYGQW